MKRVLLLAGTGEARAIARALKDDGRFEVIASYAGATSTPADLGVETRRGGFGGAAGLEGFIEDRSIDLLVDATHPFAARMKSNAAAQKIERLHVIRRPWNRHLHDRWISCTDLDTAARRLPADARAFLALGHRHLAAFQDHKASVWVRSIEPQPDHEGGRGDNFHWITGSPGSSDEETALFQACRFTHLVCRNSGGDSGYGKIEAARRLNLPVLMIERPPPPAGSIVATPAQAIDWCLRHAGT